MKSIITIALILGAGPVAAQTTAPATANAGALTLDTPVETLMSNPKARAVLATDLGLDLTAHPAYEMLKTKSLKEIEPISHGKITDAMLTKVRADLATIR